MIFNVDDLEVIFPYDYVYPEQLDYMHELKRTLDVGGHCLLEMPSGTGKTITLLSLIVAYIQSRPNKIKLVYCSRTVPEIEKALAELDNLIKFRTKVLGREEPFLGLGLSSRKNLCVHPEVSREKNGKALDARCMSLTASWVRERAQANSGEVPLCEYFETLEAEPRESSIPNGVYTLEELKQYGIGKTHCPYFLARRVVSIVILITLNNPYHFGTID